MQYRTLGKTGLKVSLLGMGCMRLPFIGGDGNNGVDKDAAIEQIQYAADNGVTYFDNALGYHSKQSESIMGEALESRRSKVLYVTKQPWWEMPDDDSIRRNLEETLKKLRTDYIDLYLLHRIIPEEWENIKKREIMKHFENFKREGLI
jgi:predicted aldo/keto reductase-like oxidoreductase